MTDSNIPYRPGMTLMPGQSTTISVAIPKEVAAQMGEGAFHFVEVPPPAKAPVQDIAESLGLCAGLRASRGCSGQWRCSACRRMQNGDSWQVWVPDSVTKGDPAWSVTEAARRNAYNGHGSAWCLACAPKEPGRELQKFVGLLPRAANDTNYFPLAFAVAMGAAALMAIMATLPQ